MQARGFFSMATIGVEEIDQAFGLAAADLDKEVNDLRALSFP